MNDSKKPIISFKSGSVGRAGLSLAVWEREKFGYSIKVGKRYKTKEGTWVESQYLDGQDMVVLSFLCNQAAAWIASQDGRKVEAPNEATEVNNDEIPF